MTTSSRLLALFLGRSTTSRLQFDSLDGLRAVAALAVVVGHMPLLNLPLFPGTFALDYAKTGVYLFFSLSAFLLTQVLLGSLGAADESSRDRTRLWLRYAVRRVLRIYPMYIVVLLQQWSIWLRHKIPIYGITFPILVDHLLLQAGKGVFWTIAVEFKFYFVLPFVVIAIVALRERLVAVSAALLAAAAAAVWLWPGEAYALNTLSLGPYLPIFLLGSLAGFWHWHGQRHGRARTRRAEWVFECVAIAAALGLVALNSALWSDELGRPLRRFAFARHYWAYGIVLAVFLYAQMNGVGWTRRALSVRPLRFVGIISFSVYLIHGAVVALVRGAVDPSVPGRSWIAFVAILLVASLSYLLVERPFLRLGLRVFRSPQTPSN